jgi:hypothetical protein
MGPARTALKEGVDALLRHPLVTAAAVLATVTAALAVRAALTRALCLTLLATDPAEALASAAAPLILGGAFAGLLLDAARATALSAYGAAPRSAPALLGDGLRRLPAFVAIGLLRRTVALVLLLGVGACVLQSRRPVMGLALAPALFVLLCQAAAARCAEVLIGRGLPLGRALVHGIDLALRRAPSLCRLAAAIGGLALPLVAAAAAARGLLGSAALTGAAALVGLWGYASLGALIGRDPRLATG